MDTRQMLTTMFIALLCAVVVSTPVACTMRRHQLIADAIKAGADPTAAKCAIEGQDGAADMARCVANDMARAGRRDGSR